MERYNYHPQLEFVFHCKVRHEQSFDWIKISISIRQFLAW